MAPKVWNWRMKNEVRGASFFPFVGKQYGMFMELPGNQCLSLREAHTRRAISSSSVLRLAENKLSECPQIDAGVRELGFARRQYSLFRGEIEQVDLCPDESVGLLNYDMMTQPNGFSLEFLDRLPYQDDAGVICTFQNPATRSISDFMGEAHDVIQSSSMPVMNYLRRQYQQKQYGLTLDRNGTIVSETLEARPNFYRWGEVLMAVVAYAMRNHNFRLDKVITYSANEKSLEFRMTTIILTGVSRKQGTSSPSHRAPPDGRDRYAVEEAALTSMRRYFHG